ncbi:MAG TPA: hypothetical protein VFK04_00560 [Gemmatimonadaceae bacterium]|nr:hypothetical protein [Gemmatimonadaceae bacterium]
MRFARWQRSARTFLLSLAALLAIGCDSDPIAPSVVAGTYVLLSVDGDALPADAGYSGPADEPVLVLADTLRLAADGSGSLVRVEEIVHDPSSGEGTRYRSESTLHYTTTEGGIAITFDCPPSALMMCVAGPHMTARLGAAELIATRLLGSQQEELVYAPVQRLD